MTETEEEALMTAGTTVDMTVDMMIMDTEVGSWKSNHVVIGVVSCIRHSRVSMTVSVA